jgi:hypothetical protein
VSAKRLLTPSDLCEIVRRKYENYPLDKLDCIHAEQVWKRCEWHCKVCGKVMD